MAPDLIGELRPKLSHDLKINQERSTFSSLPSVQKRNEQKVRKETKRQKPKVSKASGMRSPYAFATYRPE